MDELGSIWVYQENLEDLRHKLLCSSIELESYKMEAKEQMRNSEDKIKNLIELIHKANTERDEAKQQLQTVLTKISLQVPTNHNRYPLHPNNLSPESPLLFQPNKANSGLTESSTHAGASSPAAVSSPEFSSFIADPADAVIEALSKKRPLPEKGRLMQSVMEAGPLLTTLLVAGPLPEWRNPPPIQQFRIPPVSVTAACNTQQSCSSSSMLSFGGGGGSSGSRMMTMSSSSGDRFPMKRQRLY